MARVPLSAQDPARVGAYWLAGRLGSGRQGDVYEGYDEAGHRVAVTVLREGGFPGGPARREAAAVRRVASFCTARVLDCDLDAERPYIVSEFVAGPTLRAVVAEHGPLAGDDLRRLATGTATAVTAIHAAGAVHRDLRPDNVLLGPDGPRVVGFGAARILAFTGTSSHDLPGTAHYLAPELFGGGCAGPEADVYAWAAIILFAATGLPPHPGGDAAAAIHRAPHAVPGLTALPEVLRRPVAAALSKNPANRPTAEALLLRLLTPPAGTVSAGDAAPAGGSGSTGGGGPSGGPGGGPGRGLGRGGEHAGGDFLGEGDELTLEELLVRGEERARGLRVPAGLAGPPALGDAAEAAYRKLSGWERERVPATFLRLIGEDGRTPRRAEPGEPPEPVPPLGGFLDAGLLAEDDDGGLTLASAAVIPAWPRLRAWVREEGEGLGVLARLRSAARFWRDHGRRDGDLPRGTLFEQVTTWAAAGRTRIELDDLERAFLESALRAAARRERRRRTVITVLAAMVAVLLTAATGLVLLNIAADAERERARAQRDQALSRQLVAQSQALAITAPQTARLLAVAAGRIVPPSPETRAAIRAATARPQLAVLGGFPGEVHSVAFGPDGATLAATGRGAPLRMWDTTRLAPVAWPVAGGEGDEDGMAVAYSGDGTRLAVAGPTGRVRVWDTATRRGWTGGERTPWTRQWAAFSPDGSLLATAGGSTGASRLWDAASGTPVAALHSLEGAPGPVAFSPDGTLIAAAYPRGPIRTFEVASGRLTGDPLEPAAGSVTPEPREEVAALAFSPDGRLLAGTTGSERIQLWDVATRRVVGRPLTGHTGLITSAAFSPDGGVLATASQDGTIRLWDVRGRRPLGDPLTGHTHAVNAVAFSPDGGVLASASADATVRLWRLPRGTRHRLTLIGPEGGQVPADRPVPPRWYERPDTTQAVLSADAGRLVVQPYDGSRAGYGSIWSWDVRSARWRGERLRIRPDDLVDGVALGPDGRSLAASGSFDDDRGLNTTILDGPASVHGRPLAYGPDGRLLATTGPDASVRVWTLPDGRASGAPLAGHPARVTAAAFSPDGGTLLAVGTADGSVLLWEVATGRQRGVLRGHTLPVTSLAFGPGGALLLSGSEDRTARLWKVSTARPHGGPLTGHTGQVQAVAFAPDGTYLATGSLDRTVRLWDTATGVPLGPPSDRPRRRGAGPGVHG
ncbi:WD40 repeat domain-containing serine/threonine protein kinase [Nonomuraea sp. MTCD27]|uniref:WD40 repeat domain-containing serine/threonine protein kinase n=1 Tax=Nonomuraea sp. MTCD27 TaxID=1676747 RepID=UPI0035BEEE23